MGREPVVHRTTKKAQGSQLPHHCGELFDVPVSQRLRQLLLFHCDRKPGRGNIKGGRVGFGSWSHMTAVQGGGEVCLLGQFHQGSLWNVLFTSWLCVNSNSVSNYKSKWESASSTTQTLKCKDESVLHFSREETVSELRWEISN